VADSAGLFLFDSNGINGRGIVNGFWSRDSSGFALAAFPTTVVAVYFWINFVIQIFSANLSAQHGSIIAVNFSRAH
jgi:hypothetical protein